MKQLKVARTDSKTEKCLMGQGSCLVLSMLPVATEVYRQPGLLPRVGGQRGQPGQ
jgi:hypothetical protein